MALEFALTGQVTFVIREIDSAEYGPLGAMPELHLHLDRPADAAWCGLWQSEGTGSNVIALRTAASQNGFIVMGIDEASNFDQDVVEVVRHVSRTNDAYRRLAATASAAATRASQIIAGMQSQP